MAEPNSTSTIKASPHVVSANTLVAKVGHMAKPSMGEEVHFSHGLAEGGGEREYLLSDNMID